MLTHGDAIRARREQRHLTQAELAALTETTVKTVQRAEAGGPVSAAVARAIARVLAMTAIAVVQPGVEELAERLRERGLCPPLPPSEWVARDAEAAAVIAQVFAAEPGRRIAALAGPSGIGKTSIAAHVARTVAATFAGNLIWIDAWALVSEEQVRGVMQLLDETLDLGVGHVSDLASFARATRSALWQRELALVLDDVRDAQVVEAFTAGVRSCRCVITTYFRHIAEQPGTFAIEVAPLPSADALAVLAHVIEPARLEADPRGTAQLLELLGGVPRSVRQAGLALHRESLTTPADYARRLAGWNVAELGPLGAELDHLQHETRHAHFAPFIALRRHCSTEAWTLLIACAIFGEARFPAAWALALVGLEERTGLAALGELVDLHLVGVAARSEVLEPVAPAAPAPLDHLWLRLDTHAQTLTRAFLGRDYDAVFDRFVEHLIAEQRRHGPVSALFRRRWLARHRALCELALDRLCAGLPTLPPVTELTDPSAIPTVTIGASAARQLGEILAWFDLDLVHYLSDVTSPRLGLALAATHTHREREPLLFARLLHLAGWWRATSILGWESGRAWMIEASRIQREHGDPFAAACSLSLTLSPTRVDELHQLEAECLALMRASDVEGERRSLMTARLGGMALMFSPDRAAWARARDYFLQALADARQSPHPWVSVVARINVATASCVLEPERPAARADLDLALRDGLALLSRDDLAMIAIMHAHAAHFGVRLGHADLAAVRALAHTQWAEAVVECRSEHARHLAFFLSNVLFFQLLPDMTIPPLPPGHEPAFSTTPIHRVEGYLLPGLSSVTSMMMTPVAAATPLVDEAFLDTLDSLPESFSDGTLIRICSRAMRQKLAIGSDPDPTRGS